MSRYRVISEFIDKRTGERIKPGVVDFFDPSPDQASRLVKAGCLIMAEAEGSGSGKGSGGGKKPSSTKPKKSV